MRVVLSSSIWIQSLRPQFSIAAGRVFGYSEGLFEYSLSDYDVRSWVRV